MEVKHYNIKEINEPFVEEALERVREVLTSGNYILGKNVKELEERMAQTLGSKYAVTAASGSDSLVLSMLALGIKPGDEVITTPFTFIATAGCISLLGAKPVFADVHKDTYTLNPEEVKKEITDKTKAILPVHLYGQPADMDELKTIADENDLKIVEDCVHAHTAEYKGRKVGSIGDIGCFSFFPTKNLGGIGEGGLLTTNNDELYERIKAVRIHGAKVKYYNELLGKNSRYDEIKAAVVLAKLNHLKDWTEKRRENAKLYNSLLKDVVKTPVVKDHNKHVYHQYTVIADKRDELYEHLKKNNVESFVYYPIPLHLLGTFKDLKHKEGDMPNAEYLAKNVLSLPIVPETTKEQINYVADTIKDF